MFFVLWERMMAMVYYACINRTNNFRSLKRVNLVFPTCAMEIIVSNTHYRAVGGFQRREMRGKMPQGICKLSSSLAAGDLKEALTRRPL